MSTLTKVFIVLTAIFSITSSVLFIGYAAQESNWKKVAQSAETRAEAEWAQRAALLASTEAALAMKGEQVAAAMREIADLQKKLGLAADREATLTRNLAEKTNEAAGFEAGRTKLQEILDVQTAQLRSAEEQNRTLVTQGIDLQTRNTRLNSRVLELTARITILTEETRNLQEKLYAAERTASAGPGRGESGTPAGAVAVRPSVSGPIRAEVIEVRDNYVSINAGESSGVQKGMTFLLSRDGQYVGDLVIDRVRPTEAGGKVQLAARGAVSMGDSAAFGVSN